MLQTFTILCTQMKRVGGVIGLDEVQLLDPIPVERITKLTACLGDNDLYLAYQYGLVLAAWGVREGAFTLST